MFTKNTNFDLTVPSLEISKLINNLNIITNKKNESFLIQNIKFQNVTRLLEVWVKVLAI